VADTSRGANVETGTAEYSERLYVTWYWWLLPLLAAGLLAAEVHLGSPGVRAWLPYVVLLPLTALAVYRFGSATVRVTGGELRVGPAHVPLHHLGEVEVFSADQKRRVLGPELDPAAFLLHRGWVGPFVRVQLTDPTDPTPYWVLSTRHPERLAEALRS